MPLRLEAMPIAEVRAVRQLAQRFHWRPTWTWGCYDGPSSIGGDKRFVANGIDTHYEMSGIGAETVSLVHGLSLALDMWDPQLAALESLCQVLRYDIQGLDETEGER